MTTPLISAEKSPVRSVRFTQHRNFQKTLNERVNTYLRENKLTGRDLPAMYLKSFIVIAWWAGTYLLMLLGHFPPLVNLVLCVVWAMSVAAVGFNAMHDAVHGGFSDHPLINKLYSFSGEMLGMSGFRWRTKHNIWHHTYTNISGFDDDLEAFGLMRLTPRDPWKPLHQAQAWYYPLVYSFIGFDFILRDFMMVLVGKSDENHVYPKMSTSDKVIFWSGKLFHVLVMFVLPLQVFPWWQVLIGYTVMMLTVGMLMAVVFQLAHINPDVAFPVPVGSPPQIENEWAIHQVSATADFAPHNWLLNFYVGGLNYQIEHHLFPHICHLVYPRLAPIVRATCEEFGIPYQCYPTWRASFAAHLRQLRLNGRKPEMQPV